MASWHVPSISLYRAPRSDEALHVLFLQRLPEEERAHILRLLENDDVQWAKSIDSNVHSRRPISIPWIRDFWPSSDTILEVLSKNKTRDYNQPVDVFNSFVLVDSGWEAATVIAARWETNESGKSQLAAARVPISEANILLTLCDRGSLASLADALGRERYDESSVDFYKDRDSREQDIMPTAPAYRPPDFLPKDLALSRERPVIVSLMELTGEERSHLLTEIARGKADSESPNDVVLHSWEGPSPDRQGVLHLFNWMEQNCTENDDGAYAFFVDNITRDVDGKPQILAAERLVSRKDNNEITLVPVITSKFWPFWKVVMDRTGGFTMDVCDIWAQERVVELKQPLDFLLGCCPVFFLEQFTQDQEWTIRKALQKLHEIEQGTDWGAEWFYVPSDYLWPTDAEQHTIHQLRDVFERCDPKSPFFDPTNSPLRFLSYPHNFIAVDGRALDPEHPRVLLASSLDFSGDRVEDKLGWIYGLQTADEAHIHYVNLDIANMGPEEVLEDPQHLWLSDLKTYAEEDWEREAN